MTEHSGLTKLILKPSLEASRLGLVVKGTLSKADYIEAFNQLDQIEGAIHWWIGDLVSSYEGRYGSIKEIADALPFKYGTVYDDKYVASRYELSSRNESLSFKHHRIVAPLENRQEWLEEAIKKHWSARDLARAVQETRGKLPWLKYTDLWIFADCDTRFGVDYEGRIPGQIVQNLLYYFTREDDLVIDPMAGGGVTIDVCKHMNRRCIAMDKDPAREDIIKHDTTKNPWPVKEKADLIFLDPPYGNMLAYGYPQGEFETVISASLSNAIGYLKEGKLISVLIAPQVIKEKIDWTFEIYRLLKEKLNLSFFRRVMVPISTQQIGPQIMADAKTKQYMVAQIRDLLIFQKV